MSQPSVLVVEDNDLERQITVETLREEGFLVDEAPNGKRAMEQLALGGFDVVLTDLLMPGMTGEELLAAVRQTHPGSQVVLLTAHGTIESAVKATKSGAFEYLTKPTDREKLVMTVGKAAEFASLAQENILLRTRLEGKFQIEGIIGQHPAIEDVIRVVRKVAPSYSTVLIQGESGTGKEVIARAIHKLSPRALRPFVAINCSAIPDSLIENELFGHERGAFTGANERKIGLIESADKSTLFLDEIADLDIGLQAKLLRVLQERELRRVGGNESIRVDVRLVAATNRESRRGGRRGTLSRGPLLPHQRRHRSRCRRCATAARTSRCWRQTRSRTDSPTWRGTGLRRSAAKRWRCCSTIRGRATCASSNRRSSARMLLVRGRPHHAQGPAAGSPGTQDARPRRRAPRAESASRFPLKASTSRISSAT